MKNHRFLITLTVGASLTLSPAAFGEDKQTLQGSIEKAGVLDEMPAPDMPTPVVTGGTSKKKRIKDIYDEDFGKDQPLQGNISKDTLNGDLDDADLQPGVGQMDGGAPLKGSATSEGISGLKTQDPDMDDQELMVEWDKWRNRFLWAVQSGVQECLNNPEDAMLKWDPQKQTIVMKFPLGTTAWFTCKVTNQRRIESIKLLHSSGFPGYDDAVVNAVKMLEGTSILKFPGRSRRLTVRQTAGIKTSDQGGRQFFKFGDVERYRQ